MSQFKDAIIKAAAIANEHTLPTLAVVIKNSFTDADNNKIDFRLMYLGTDPLLQDMFISGSFIRSDDNEFSVALWNLQVMHDKTRFDIPQARSDFENRLKEIICQTDHKKPSKETVSPLHAFLEQLPPKRFRADPRETMSVFGDFIVACINLYRAQEQLGTTLARGNPGIKPRNP